MQNISTIVITISLTGVVFGVSAERPIDRDEERGIDRTSLEIGAASRDGAPAMPAAGTVADAEVVIAEGWPAPGTPGLLVTNLNSPFTDGNGLPGFTGAVDDEGSTDNFVWYSAGVTWRNSDALPDSVTGAEGTMGVGNAGEFIYSPAVNGLDAVWISQAGGTTVFAKNDPAPGFPGQLLSFCSRPRMIPGATASWIAGLTDEPGGSSQARVLYSYDGTTATPVLASGDNVGGFTIDFPSGVDFDYQFSDNGGHHIQVLLMDTGSTVDDGFVYVDGALVARETDPNGDGDNWDNFDIVSINDAGDYIFTGDTDGPTTSDEFIAYNGTIAIREGDVIDGVTLLGGSFRAASINNLGRVVHLWGISGGAEVLFAGDGSNLAATSVLLLQTGDLVDVDGDTLADAVILDFNASIAIGPGLDLAADGFVYVEVDLEDLESGAEFEAILRAALPAGCPTDIDGDGETGFSDLLVVLSTWGPCPGPGACAGDVDGDGIVGFSDLLEILSLWGPCA